MAVYPQDPMNNIVQDTAGVWRLVLDGEMLGRYPNQNAALEAYNQARSIPE